MSLTLENADLCFFKTDTIDVSDTTYWICTGGTMPDCTDSVAGWADTTYWVCKEWDQTVCIDSFRVPPDDPYDMMHLPNWDFFHVKDTIAVVGSIASEGALIDGWEQIDSRASLTVPSAPDEAMKVTVTARANANFTDGINTPGVPAGQHGGVLFRLLTDIREIDDTVTVRSVDINVQSAPTQEFVFSTPDAEVVGIAYEHFMDTNFYRCEGWMGETCLSWIKVTWPPYDSIHVVPDSSPYIDTMGVVMLDHGSLTVLTMPLQCGNINGSEDGLITLADITGLIDFVYISKEPLENECIANVNCSTDGLITLADITTLIDHVYISKEELCPGCCD
jgi:hypothetical protein